MRPAGFEPGIPASERLQTHALERAATVTSVMKTLRVQNTNKQTKTTAVLG